MPQYWYLLAAAVLAAAACYAAACVRALRPRVGTLEWIARYDRPRLALAGARFPIVGRDVPLLLCCCLAAAIVWGFAAVWVYGDAGRLPMEEQAAAAAAYLLAPALAAAAAYAVLKELFGSSLTALLGALLLASNIQMEPVSLLVCTMTLWLLLRYLTAPAEGGFGQACPPLLLAFAALAAGCYFSPAALGLTALALALLLAGGVLRFAAHGRGWTVRGLAWALAVWALTTLLLHIPAAVVEGMAFPGLLVSGDYYRLVAGRLAALLPGGAEPYFLLVAVSFDWPLLLFGLCAGAAALRDRDCRGLLPALLALGLIAVWFLWDAYLLPVAAVGGLCGLWGALCRRGRVALAVCAASCLLLTQLALLIIPWLL